MFLVKGVPTMIICLSAPDRTRLREQAQVLLQGLPAVLEEAQVEVSFDPSVTTTISFVDELIREVLVRRGAASLRLVSPTNYTCGLALQSAGRNGVADRLLFERTKSSAA